MKSKSAYEVLLSPLFLKMTLIAISSDVLQFDSNGGQQKCSTAITSNERPLTTIQKQESFAKHLPFILVNAVEFTVKKQSIE